MVKTFFKIPEVDFYRYLPLQWFYMIPDSQDLAPDTEPGIGIDMLPPAIRNSKILTGNYLEQLANVLEMPVVDPSYDDSHLKQIILYYSISPDEMEKELHAYAKKLLDEGKVKEAWQVLLTSS